MKTPPPRSPEIEALLAPHRTILPLAPSVEARAIARAAAATESPQQSAGLAFGPPRWVLAVAAGVVLCMGAGAAAYAARAWIGTLLSRASAPVPPIASPPASAPRQYIPVASEVEPTAAIAPRAAGHGKRGAVKASASTVATNAELQLLRAAREDVTHGDFGGALAVIAEHVRRFRNGILVEEREALRVESLAGLGRHEEAQRAAAAFHARFPRSVFLSTFSTFERMLEADR